MTPEELHMRQRRAYAEVRRDLAALEQDEAFARAEYDKVCALQLLDTATHSDVTDVEARLTQIATEAMRKRAAIRHLWESVGSGDGPPVAST